MLSQCRMKTEGEGGSNEKCCTRSKIQSKIGLGNAGSAAYSLASIPTAFGFPFAELGAEPWIKQGSPKLREALWSVASGQSAWQSCPGVAYPESPGFQAAHQASWQETSLEPCLCCVGSSLNLICLPEAFQFWWIGIFQWKPVLLLNSSPAVSLNAMQQQFWHPALAATSSRVWLGWCWVLV